MHVGCKTNAQLGPLHMKLLCMLCKHKVRCHLVYAVSVFLVFTSDLLCCLTLREACGNRMRALVVNMTGPSEDRGRQRHSGGQRSACGGARGGRCTQGAAAICALQGAGCSTDTAKCL